MTPDTMPPNQNLMSVKQPQPAVEIHRPADRRPSPAFVRNMMVVQALTVDTSRSSRRAQAAVLRNRSDKLAAPPSEYNSSPNWLKIALNAQRR